MGNKHQFGTAVVRRSQERGQAHHGWLKSFHSFSFADYYDPQHMGFRSLRVINEDWVQGGQGFGRHPHQDMEIFTYVIEGALEHQDSMGHKSIIKAGDVQKITAGTGIYHSEVNASMTETVHLLQIWILPQQKGLKPSYEEYSLPPQERDTLLLIGSPRGGQGVVQFNQDVHVYRGRLIKGQETSYQLKKGRGIWIQIIIGQLQVQGNNLSSGDAFAVEQEGQVTLMAKSNSEFLLFDLA